MIASNSAVSANKDFIDSVMQTNPLPLLQNPNLGQVNFNNVVNYVMDILEKSPPIELDRFKSTWRSEGKTIRTKFNRGVKRGDKYDAPMTYIRRLIDKSNWIAYWRGGTFKKKLKLPSDQNIAPIGSKGKPMAIVDEPILIEKTQVIVDMELQPFSMEEQIIGKSYRCNDCGNKYNTMARMEKHLEEYGHEGVTETDVTELVEIEGDEFWKLNPESRIRYIKEISVNEDGTILVKGTKTDTRTSETSFEETYKDVNEMYGYNPDYEEIKVSGNVIMDENIRELIVEKGKWNNSITLVLFDVVNKEDIILLPEWRMNLTQESIDSCLLDIFANPLMTDKGMVKFLQKHTFKHNIIVKDNQSLSFNILNTFKAINKADKWTRDIINEYATSLFGRDEYYRTANLDKLKPTGEILEATLSQDTALIQGILGSRPRIKHLQDWVLSNYGSQVPIRYIYDMIDNPTADAYVIDKAKQLRSARINEFLEYAAGLNPEALGAEEFSAASKVEWTILKSPSKINNLLVEYVEIIHPNDESKQNELMDSIVSGKII